MPLFFININIIFMEISMVECKYCRKEFEKQTSLSKHRCSQKRLRDIDILKDNKAYFLDEYTKGVSLDKLRREFDITGKHFKEFLKENGVEIRGVSETRELAMLRAKETMIERYGVENASMLEETKEKVRNTCREKYGSTNGENSYSSKVKHYIKMNIPWDDTGFSDYKKEVWRITKKEKKKIIFTGECYYTKVNIFKDNWINDPYHASVDHRISVMDGFERGLSPEVIGNVDNLCYCSRLCNSVKCAYSEEDFLNSPKFRRLKYYELNKDNYKYRYENKKNK